MKTVKDVQDELQSIAAELRTTDASGASEVDALHKTFYTTTTEYLVEALGLMQRLQSRATVRAAGLDGRLRALEQSARKVANLR